jgi:hypothetical protein
MSDTRLGVNSCRGEVVIAALADAVVTRGYHGIEWISGGADRWSLPAEVTKAALRPGVARLVAFMIADERTVPVGNKSQI